MRTDINNQQTHKIICEEIKKDTNLAMNNIGRFTNVALYIGGFLSLYGASYVNGEISAVRSDFGTNLFTLIGYTIGGTVLTMSATYVTSTILFAKHLYNKYNNAFCEEYGMGAKNDLYNKAAAGVICASLFFASIPAVNINPVISIVTLSACFASSYYFKRNDISQKINIPERINDEWRIYAEGLQEVNAGMSCIII